MSNSRIQDTKVVLSVRIAESDKESLAKLACKHNRSMAGELKHLIQSAVESKEGSSS